MSGSFGGLPGHKGSIATVVLALCFGGWVLQLAGIAGQQAVCEDELSLNRNEVDAVGTFVRQMRLALQTGQTVDQKVFVGQTVNALSVLAKRSTSSIFVLTPDAHCKTFYRYQWVNVALQFIGLTVAVVAMASGKLHAARIAICTFLSVCTAMAINNANTWFHVREYVTDNTLLRGKVFFAGCFITTAMNLLLCLMLGWEDDTPAPAKANQQYTKGESAVELEVKPATA